MTEHPSTWVQVPESSWNITGDYRRRLGYWSAFRPDKYNLDIVLEGNLLRIHQDRPGYRLDNDLEAGSFPLLHHQYFQR
jgi:hypothetical protein